ncbi:MAG: DNA-directed RNA polymerase subunit beta' [Candidatus Doudnabacteria bacterium RIFCSPHIGHO2_01_FULL_46_14]|uniref:DNA-directed RNA polymerase subunit beta' n=1 Tax=Candidatus Doudnabacteria bacterium RIFCSPHIGHO2_01_FULL_46_14 TaxID=1817824 RepID=A0A1F5NK44_9BACT|nr:MAG: DNA-directed RNA polymerase subunit beta' [Candidatus Doudnabacteria bacterium RIFCSPHIGHO2_01_FULL_46_14]
MFTKSAEFKAVQVKIASSEQILNWSYGEVTKPETINYRTQRPEKDGLFDEKIFGPVRDWECYCGKYKRIRYKGIICDKCGVEVTRAQVRRERMGHIKLAVPVAHIWFLRGVPSRLGLTLNLSVQELEKVIYFASYVITEVREDIRTETLDQIEKEFKIKKKEIESKYEKLIAKARTAKPAAGQNADVFAAQIDTDLAKLQENLKHDISALEKIRDLARSELKSLKKMQVISELEYRDLSLKYGPVFKAGIGAEAIFNLVKSVDMEKLIIELEAEVLNTEGAAYRKAIKRLKLIKSLVKGGMRPEWMMISNLPVIPPDLRPMVQLDGGRFAASDLNDLYRRVINRNNRLKRLLEINAPEVITRNEKRMLQEAVDALIDNSVRHGKEVTASTGQRRKLRSLADMLKGKQGRFRQNLLGKRVDYSGRSVIVVGPELKLHQCGLPKRMALELFKPFVISKLIAREFAHNVRSANRLIEQERAEVYDILEEVTKDHYVLLNRAPTLHRLGFQAFQPVLIEGKAIQIHPMVCQAFNADFDGDQMAVHVPLTSQAQFEAKEMMSSSRNLLKPASGEPIMTPDKDVVLGCYYITRMQDGLVGEGKIFADPQEAILAEKSGIISIKAKVKVRMNGKIVETCVGRILFNQILPEEMQFLNEVMDKKRLRNVLRECYRQFGTDRTAVLIDDIKQMGFAHLTVSGLSWGMDDLQVPAMKKGLLDKADEEVQRTYDQYREGLLTESERYNRVVEIWAEVRDKVTDEVSRSLDQNGSVFSMVSSGARGSLSQVSQMTGMKGLVVNPAGDVIELPVRDSFKEGLSILEYFISTHGSRKGMSDTALRTADAGYLTRRLVDVSQDVVVNEEDCGTREGVTITRKETEEVGKGLGERIFGRVLAVDMVDEKTKKAVLKRGQVIDDTLVKTVDSANVSEVLVRSVMNCTLKRGVCAACYGFDLGFNKMVNLGAAVGIVAAQAIGEPGTQLTMRTFHTGGVAGLDITQGLPRVEELFEARDPKGQAVISEIDGIVYISRPNSKEIILRVDAENIKKDEYLLPTGQAIQLTEGEKVKKGEPIAIDADGKTMKAKESGIVRIEMTEDGGKKIVVVRENENFNEYIIPSAMHLTVKDGDLVIRGQQLTEGNLNLHQLMQLRGTLECQAYIIREVQKIYSSQGQNIADKHVEIIVRQMFSKLRITDSGDSDFLVGDVVDRLRLDAVNEQLVSRGVKKAAAEQLLMGITKSSLNTESFLAAASFQETTRVLIEAAVSAKTDYLRGLKENVIIGKLIPAGTGFSKDRLIDPGALDETVINTEE